MLLGLLQILVGRAGYLSGYLWLRSQNIETLSQQEVFALCDLMVQCGREYSGRVKSPSRLMYQVTTIFKYFPNIEIFF